MNSGGLQRNRQGLEPGDHRNTVLLVLAGILFCAGLAGLFPSLGSLTSQEVPTLSMGHSGLVLQSPINDGSIRVSVELAPFFFQPLPVNEASEELLTTIPGIGPVLARSIVNSRIQDGLFTRPEDLIRVRGIGKKRMVWLSRHLSFQ